MTSRCTAAFLSALLLGVGAQTEISCGIDGQCGQTDVGTVLLQTNAQRLAAGGGADESDHSTPKSHAHHVKAHTTPEVHASLVKAHKRNRGSDSAIVRLLDFTTAELIFNNLGGQGPKKLLDSGEPAPKEIRYRNLVRNQAVDLVITAGADYTSHNSNRNGILGANGQINAKSGTSVNLTFAFVKQGTNNPHVMPMFYMTFSDIDERHGGAEAERITVDSFEKYYTNDDIKIINPNATIPTFQSSDYGNYEDNDFNPDSPEPVQLSHAVTYLFQNKASFHVTFQVESKRHFNSGRNVLFSGISQLVFCQEPSTTLEFANSRVTVNNLGGHGPNLDDAQEIRYSNIATTADGVDVDLVIQAVNPAEYLCKTGKCQSGSALTTSKTQTAQDCQHFCAETAHCIGYSYTPSTSDCRLSSQPWAAAPLYNTFNCSNAQVTCEKHKGYTAWDTSSNGLHGDFGEVNLFCGDTQGASEADFTVTIVRAGTEEQVVLNAFAFVIFDFDSGLHEQQVEYVELSPTQPGFDAVGTGYASYVVTSTTEIAITDVTGTGKKRFMATKHGTGADNPNSSQNLAREVADKAIEFTFRKTSRFSMRLGITSTGSDAGRNFMFSGQDMYLMCD